MAQKKSKRDPGIICENRRARHNYDIEATWEAGIALAGSEVKSVRDRRVNMSDAYAVIENNDVFLMHLDISPWPQAHHFNHEAKRPRRLLLHRAEIDKLRVKVNERGYTLVPLDLHFKDGRVKVTLALAKGRKIHDNRREIRDDQERREMRSLLERS